MEHLLDQEDLELLQETPQVPWLGYDHDTAREYEVVSFEQYPVLRGWSSKELDQIKEGKILSRNAISTLAMLQSWFLFGFLEAACQEHFSSADFVVQDTMLLKTGFLRKYFSDKAAKLRVTPEIE